MAKVCQCQARTNKFLKFFRRCLLSGFRPPCGSAQGGQFVEEFQQNLYTAIRPHCNTVKKIGYRIVRQDFRISIELILLRIDRAITGLLKDFCLDFSFGLLHIVSLFYKAGFLCRVRITGDQVVNYRIFVQFLNFLIKFPLQGFQLLRACLKSFDKREGKADKKGKQAGDDGECVNIQAISGGKSMKRYERI